MEANQKGHAARLILGIYHIYEVFKRLVRLEKKLKHTGKNVFLTLIELIQLQFFKPVAQCTETNA